MIDKAIYYFILLIIGLIPVVTFIGFIVNSTRYILETLEKSFENNYRNWKFIKDKEKFGLFIPREYKKSYIEVRNEIDKYGENGKKFLVGFAMSLLIALIFIAFFHFLGNSLNWLPAKYAIETIDNKLSYLFSISTINDFTNWYANDFDIIFKIILYLLVFIFAFFFLWNFYLAFLPLNKEIENHNKNVIKNKYKQVFEEYINHKENYINLLSKSSIFRDAPYFFEDSLKSEIRTFKKYYLRYGDDSYKTEPFFNRIDEWLKDSYKYVSEIYDKPSVEKYYFENYIEEDYLLEKLVTAGKKHNLLK